MAEDCSFPVNGPYGENLTATTQVLRGLPRNLLDLSIVKPALGEQLTTPAS